MFTYQPVVHVGVDVLLVPEAPVALADHAFTLVFREADGLGITFHIKFKID